MTVRSISSEELQALAFDNPGTQIQAGAHAMHLRVGDVEYSARYEDLGGAA